MRQEAFPLGPARNAWAMANASARAVRGAVDRNRYRHELDLVEGAIGMIVAGGAQRVSLVIPHGALILSRAQSAADRKGVILRAEWRGGGVCDLVVEPIA